MALALCNAEAPWLLAAGTLFSRDTAGVLEAAVALRQEMTLVVGEWHDVTLNVGDAPFCCRDTLGLGDAVGVDDVLVAVCIGVCEAAPAANGLLDGNAPDAKIKEGVTARGECVK